VGLFLDLGLRRAQRQPLQAMIDMLGEKRPSRSENRPSPRARSENLPEKSPVGARAAFFWPKKHCLFWSRFSDRLLTEGLAPG
jgi:hypothetical protein